MTAQVLRLRDERPAADLTPAEARNLTDRIRASLAELLPLIKEAFDRRADLALGYASWPDYCDAELRGLRLPIAQRREAVTELRQTGMSTRAIGAALGTSEATVRRELTASDDAVPARIVGLDGRAQPATRPSSTMDVPAGRDRVPDPGVPSVATTDRPGTTDSDHAFPLVLVSQAPRPLPPARAELREQHPTRPGIVKVVYEASRTAAWIDRSRIVESADPAPESPRDGGNGGGVTRAAGAPAPRPDDHQECVRCGDRVYTLSSDGLCDGCVEEDANAAARPVHVTLTQREAYLLTAVAAELHDSFDGDDREALLSALHKVADALIAARRVNHGEATS